MVAQAERTMIHEPLQKKAVWCEPGYARTVLAGHAGRPEPIYFQISISRSRSNRSAVCRYELDTILADEPQGTRTAAP